MHTGTYSPWGVYSVKKTTLQTLQQQPTRLNALWRVFDDGQRWRLEERIGRGRGDLWVTRGYFIDRAELLKAVELQCGAIGSEAVAAMERWPAEHRRPSFVIAGERPGSRVLPGIGVNTGELRAALL